VQFDDVEALRRRHSAWRLLRADNAPLILSFLGRVFVDENVRTIAAAALADRLDDELYALRQRLGEDAYPKTAKAYLDDWATPEAGWLRKYYPAGSDDPHMDATPAVEKALGWVESLATRSFVGTESRLNTVFELLRQMAFGAETDPETRLTELRRRRDEIDADIARVESGRVDLLDAVGQRDRYQQFASTARELFADFREVEDNFRNLDRELREQIAGWSGSKGELLDEVLGSRSSIRESDQGRSFHAFYDFLLSSAKQAEFTGLLERVQSLEIVGATDPRMRHIHYDWLDAGERTQSTVRMLSEQLRRFLDDQVWLENRRVMDILHSIEASALQLKTVPNADIATEIDGPAPTIMLPMERPLYTPTVKVNVDSSGIASGVGDFDASALFEQIYVDPARLSHTVRLSLQRQPQVGLVQVIRAQPLEQGLAELVTYLSLTDDLFQVVFDESATDEVSWQDPDGTIRVATIPGVTFRRAHRSREPLHVADSFAVMDAR
jgi:hypothetical protein